LGDQRRELETVLASSRRFGSGAEDRSEDRRRCWFCRPAAGFPGSDLAPPNRQNAGSKIVIAGSVLNFANA
jgi:hypothetical protein